MDGYQRGGLPSGVPQPNGTGPPSGTLYVRDHVEELHAVIAEHFAPHALRVLHDQPVSGRFQICHQGEVSVYVIGYGADVQIGPDELPDFYMVNIPLTGRGLVVVDGQELRSTPSVISPGQELRMGKSADGTTLVIRITRGVVDRALRELLGHQPATPLRFTAQIETAGEQARQWLALVQAAARYADNGVLSCSPLAANHFEQMLVHGLLGFQPHSQSEGLAAPVPRSSPRALRRAMSFCDEQAGEPISVGDIAAAAGVSVRTLQGLFRAHAQITPLGYLRRVRLEQAHRDLLAAADTGAAVTVTDIAMRWGFVHLSRFAQMYRATYGCSPSESLSAQRGTRRALTG